MADLDKDLSLKIAVKANEAAEAIDGLINRLRTLNQSLNLGNLNNFSRQLSQIASAANKIDGSTIKGFASSISALNKAQESLKSGENLKAVADQAENVKAKIHEMSTELAAGTKNSTQVAKELEKQLTAVFNIESKRGDNASTKSTIASNKAIDDAISSMSNLIKENLKFSNSNLEAYDTYQRLRDYIAHSGKIKVPTEELDKYATFASDMSVIGRGSLSTKEGQDFGSFIQELIGQFRELEGTIDTTASKADQFQQLAAYLRKCKEESASITQSWSAAEKADIIEHIPIEVAETADKIQQLARENKSFEGTFDSAPYQGINDALTSLQGVSLPDFKGLNELANALTKLNKIDPAHIKAIADALKGFSGNANIKIDVSGLNKVAESAKALGASAPEIQQATDAVEQMSNSVSDSSASEGFKNLNTQVQESERGIKNLTDIINQYKASSQGGEGNSIFSVKDAIDFSRAVDLEGIKKAKENVDGLTEELRETAEAFGEVGGSAQETAKEVDGVSQYYQNILTQITSVSSQMAEMRKNPDQFDASKYSEFSQQLSDLKNTWKEFEDSLSKPVRFVASDELSQEMEQISNRIREITTRMAEMKSGSSGWDVSEYKQLEAELEQLSTRYDEIIGKEKKEKGSKESVKSGNIDLLASLVALGHELQTVANALDKLGDAGISLLKKVFLPLDIAFKGFKEKVTGMVTAVKNMRTSMQKHLDKMSAFWKRTMKTFTFMLVRKAITAILNETKNAVDSLARWSNQFGTAFNTSMSEITADASYLARNLVAMFEPIINAIVPILNTLVEALARATRAVAEFFAAFTGQSYFMVAKKKVGNYAAELDKANKKQKQLTMGIDELNILNEGDSGSGSDKGAGFGDEWDTAPVSDKMKNLADEIKKILEKLFEPLKKAWDIAGDYVLGGFKYMKEEIGKLLASIGKDFLEVWNQPETVKMLTNLLYILGDIEYTIGNLANGFREAWEEGEKGKKIFEAIRDILAILIQHVRNVTLYMRGWSQNIDFNPLLEKALELLQKMSVVAEFVGGVFEDIMKNVVLKYIEFLIEKGIPHLLDTIGEIIDSFDFEKLRGQLAPLEQSFEGMLENIDKGITNAIGNVGKAVGKFTQTEDFQKFLNNVKWFMDQITAERVEKLFTILGDVILDLSEKVVKFIGSEKFKDFMTNIFEWFDNADSDKIVGAIEKLAFAIAGFKFAGFAGKGVGTFMSFLSTLSAAKNLGTIASQLGAVGGGGTAAAGGMGAFLSAAAPVAAIIAGVVAAVYSMTKSFGGIKGLMEELKKHFDDVKKALTETFINLGVDKSIDKLKESFNKLLEALGHQKGTWQFVFEILEGIAVLIGDVLLPVFKTLVDAFSASFEVISGVLDIIGGLFDMLMGFFNGDDEQVSEGWTNLCNGIQEAFQGLFDFLVLPGALMDGLVQGIKDFWGWLCHELLGDPIVLDITDGTSKAFSDMDKDSSKSVSDLVGDVIKSFGKLKQDLSSKIGTIKQDAETKWENLKKNLGSKTEKLEADIETKWENLKKNISEKVANIKQDSETKWENLKLNLGTKMSALKLDIETKWENLKKNVGDKVAKLKQDTETKWENLKTNVGTTVSTLKQDTETKWNTLKTNVETTVDNLKTELGKKWDKIKEDADEKGKPIHDSIVKPFEDAYTDSLQWISDLKDDLKKKWEKFTEDVDTNLGGLGDAIAAPFKEAYTEASPWISKLKSALDGFFDGIKTSIENSKLGDFFDNIMKKIKDLKDKMGGLKDDARQAESSTRTSSTQGYFNGGIVQYATGGYPSRGTLFWAGEYGLPEMIGTVGGKTAVASSAEITGIRESVMESSIAEQNMMGQMINLLQAIAAKDLSVNMDSRELVSSLNDRARRNGYNFQMA